MTYRVEFSAIAAEQTIGLSEEAYLALIRTLGDVASDRAVTQATHDIMTRCVVFGELGLATFRIDHRNQLINVRDVTWTG